MAPLSTGRSRRVAKAPAKPTAFNWNTTDEQEIEKRRERAREESFSISSLDNTDRILSSFRVESASGAVYTVELFDLKNPQFGCSCVDFRINGLGTCKHVEATLLYLKGRFSKLFSTATRTDPPRAVVDVDRENSRLRLDPKGATLPPSLKGFFREKSGRIHDLSPEEQLQEIRKQIIKGAPVRVTLDAERWVKMMNHRLESSRLRREYEQNVQSGKWPAQETRVPLFPYQREGMLHLAFSERALLADEMGLGKTIQAIAACALLHRLDKASRVLVVTPVSLKSEWQEQIQAFTELPFQLVSGPRTERLRAYNQSSPPFFTLVNYEQVMQDAEEINAGLRPDIVVLDEAQRIKNWNTRTAQAVKRLRSRYAFVLTGTPIENRIDEIHSIMDFIDPEVLGPLFRFNREFYELNERGRPEGLKNLDELHARIAPYLIRRRKVDVEDQLPDRTDHIRMVQMTEKQWDAYVDFKKTADRLLKTGKERPLSREQLQVLQISLSQMRMTCDTNYILDGRDRNCPKLHELRMILEEVRENDAKVIVFSEWVRMLELVRELCKSLEMGYAWHTGEVPQKKRRAEIMAFKTDPACRVFLSTDSGGTGLNLQAASIVINCDLPWNPAKLEQRIARAWRKNQTAPVTVYNLVSRDTIEEAMLGTLQTKQAIADWVIDNNPAEHNIGLSGGKHTFLQKLELLMKSGQANASGSGSTVSGRQQPPDPMAAFSEQLVQRLGSSIMRCEERFPSSGENPVMLIVVEDGPGTEETIRRLHLDFARKVTADAQFSVEILTRSVAEAVERLEQAGVLKMAVRASRPIYPAPDTHGSRWKNLSDEDVSRIRKAMEQAHSQCQASEVLLRSGLTAHAAEHLGGAIGHALRALACVAGLPDDSQVSPGNVPQVLASLWGPDYAKIQAFHESKDDPSIIKLAIEAVRGLQVLPAEMQDAATA